MRRFVLAIAAVTLGGCSEQVVAPVDADVLREALVDRIAVLGADVQKTGHLTAAHREALATLTHDVEAWQAATGRTDLVVHPPAPRGEGTFAVPRSPGLTPECESCAAVTFTASQTCFLVEQGDCPEAGSIFSSRVCVYQCFGATTTIKRR